jgi:hypothetical protein
MPIKLPNLSFVPMAVAEAIRQLVASLSHGKTEDVDVAKVGGGTRTLHFKDGLYIGSTDSP